MVTLPRLIVAAPSTGEGKTTIATGLMAAFRSGGHQVSGHKVGPDYIDPGYHALASGRPERNLDPHLVGEDRIVPLLLHGAAGADLSVIEGVMGLYDGRLGTDGFASTAHIARCTGSPVILVLDVEKMSRSAGAIAAGMAGFDPHIRVAGVILNRTGSGRNVTEISRAVERAGLTVLGVPPRDRDLLAPSEKLGHVSAAERAESEQFIEKLGHQVGHHLDLDALAEVARSAPEVDTKPWDPAAHVRAGGDSRPVVAMAGGRAVRFRYTETEELLRSGGCRVVTFDPLHDSCLPAGTRGIYLGGAFPESLAPRLAANQSLLRDLHDAVSAGIPTVAEGTGLLQLAYSYDGVAMASVVAATAAPRARLRYPLATAPGDTVLTAAGEPVTGHEFHRWGTDPEHGDRAAWTIDGEPTGFAGDTWHASYLHVHWAGHPQLAQRFVDAVHQNVPHTSTSTGRGRPVSGTEVPPEPLRHHGDAETGRALLDFAVNTFHGPRPDWLDRALHDAVDQAGAYPDPAPARTALAERHGRPGEEILPTAGGAEAFGMLARLRPWRRPVVVHPQFTEPHAALDHAGHRVTTVWCRPEDDFTLDPAAVPDEADLVVLGNPTNPTGRLHPADLIRRLQRPGRVLVVDEAFMDAVGAESESLVRQRLTGCLVVRSLTKHWSIPGIRAGYVAGDSALVDALSRIQAPWSVSTAAIAAMTACSTDQAISAAADRAHTLAQWRGFLETGLQERGIAHVPSAAPYVLARVGIGVHAALREQGVAVRRADTFPGLDGSWVRIAARPPEMTRQLFTTLDQIPVSQPAS